MAMMRSASWPERRGSRPRTSSRAGPRRWRRSSAVRRTPSKRSGGPRIRTGSSAKAGRWTRPRSWRPSPAPARSWRSAATTRTTPRSPAPSRPRRPLIFSKWPSSVIGPGAEIRWDPALSDPGRLRGRARRRHRPDGAARLARRTHSPTSSATRASNDVSARDLQFGDGQWVRGKSLDTFCPMGPAVVTTDEIPDPQVLDIACHVNGRTSSRPARPTCTSASRRSSATARRRSRSSPATSSRPARRPASASSAIRRSCSATATRWWSRSRASAGSSTPAGSTARRRPS